MSIRTEEEAASFFSHFPEEGCLTWEELIAVEGLPEEARNYFLSDRHATLEVFGRTAIPPEARPAISYAAQQLIEQIPGPRVA